MRQLKMTYVGPPDNSQAHLAVDVAYLVQTCGQLFLLRRTSRYIQSIEKIISLAQDLFTLGQTNRPLLSCRESSIELYYKQRNDWGGIEKKEEAYSGHDFGWDCQVGRAISARI